MISMSLSRNPLIARVAYMIRILAMQANWTRPMVAPLCTGLGASNGGAEQLP